MPRTGKAEEAGEIIFRWRRKKRDDFPIFYGFFLKKMNLSPYGQNGVSS